MTASALPFAGRTVNVALSTRDFRRGMRTNGGLIINELEALGCNSRLVTDGDPSGCDSDLLILYGNCRAMKHYAALLARTQDRRSRTVMWQVDPLPPRSLDPTFEAKALRLSNIFAYKRALRPLEILVGHLLYKQIAERGMGYSRDQQGDHPVDSGMARTTIESYAAIRNGISDGGLDTIYVSTIGKQRFLAERGISSTFAPYGDYPRLGEEQHAERDVDVLFIGSLKNLRRRQRLETTLEQIRNANIRIEVASRGLWGQARRDMLNRSKILLHIHKYPWDTPWMRWAMAAVNGAVVVSEPLVNPEPFKPGIHYFEAPTEGLAELIGKLLADPERLQVAADRCRNFVTSQLTLRGSVELILTDFFPPNA